MQTDSQSTGPATGGAKCPGIGRRLRAAARIAAMSGLVLLASCGGGGGGSNGTDTGSGKESADPVVQPATGAGDAATATFGPRGGSLELPSKRARITIADGDLSGPATFSISNAGPSSMLDGATPLLELGDGGAGAAGPVTVTMQYAPTKLPGYVPEEALTLAYRDNERWVDYPTAVDTVNKVLTGQASRFGTHSAKVADVTTSALAGFDVATLWQVDGPCRLSGNDRYDQAVRDLAVRLFGTSTGHCLTLPYLANGYSRYTPHDLESHAGLDFQAAESPVVSLVNGRVITATLDPAGGPSTLAILSQSGRMKVFYLHCRSHAHVPKAGSTAAAKSRLEVGDLVSAGDQVCLSGAVGTTAGEHLHVEAKLAGMDPRDPAAQAPNAVGASAIGGARCGDFTFADYLGRSARGCSLDYIRLNTIDLAWFLQAVDCTSDALATADGLCKSATQGPADQGSLTTSASACTIAAGGSSCSVSLNWSTTNTAASTTVSSDTPTANFTVFVGSSGGPSAVVVPFGGRSFYLASEGQVLATRTVSATCATGTIWNGSACQAPVMSGSLTSSAAACSIAVGAASCSVALSWSTSNPLGISTVSSDTPAANTPLFSGNSGGPSNVSVPYGSRNFILANRGQVLASKTVSAACAAGTAWNGTVCVAAPLTGSLTSSAAGCTIASGAGACSVTLTWSTTHPVTASTISSDIPTPDFTVFAGNAGGPSQVSVPFGGRTFSLVNNGQALASKTVTAVCATGTAWNGTICQTPPLSGTLTASAASCAIAAGANACSVFLTWATTSPVAISEITSDTPTPHSTVLIGNAGGPSSVSVPYGRRNFYLSNNVQLLASTTVTAACAAGTFWNGTLCQGTAISGSLSTSAASCSIARGASACSVALTWSTTNPIASSTITSDTPTANSVVLSGNAGGPTAVSVPYGGRNFFLVNNGQLLASKTVTANCAIGATWSGTACEAPAMSGSLIASTAGCSIAAAANSCTVDLIWVTTNPTATSQITSDTPLANLLLFSGNSGGPSSVSVPYGGRSFHLYNDGHLLASRTIGAACVSGTAWNGTACQALPMKGSLSASASNCAIPSGANACPVSLSWSTTNPVATSTVTSDTPTAGFTLFTGNTGGPSIVSIAYGGRNFYLYNDGRLLADKTITASCASGTTWTGSLCN